MESEICRDICELLCSVAGLTPREIRRLDIGYLVTTDEFEQMVWYIRRFKDSACMDSFTVVKRGWFRTTRTGADLKEFFPVILFKYLFQVKDGQIAFNNRIVCSDCIWRMFAISQRRCTSFELARIENLPANDGSYIGAMTALNLRLLDNRDARRKLESLVNNYNTLRILEINRGENVPIAEAVLARERCDCRCAFQ